MTHPNNVRLIALGLFVLGASTPILAEQDDPVTLYLKAQCGVAKQSEALPLLSQSCPIGKGLYGGTNPTTQPNAYFWVQCGAASQPFKNTGQLTKINKITQNNVLQAYDGKIYRCLVGPYRLHRDAYQVMRYISTLTSEQGFVRQHILSLTTPPPELAAELSKPTLPQAEQTQPAKATIASEGAIDAVIEYRVSDNERTFFIPVFHDERLAFHNESNKVWNRFNYKEATRKCRGLDADLISSEEIDKLVSMVDQSTWPRALPYWLQSGQGRFLGGQAYNATENSQLYVMCSKPNRATDYTASP